jgi:hypothetical protein
MSAIRDNVCCIGCVVFALACTKVGDDDAALSSGGAKSMDGGAGSGVSGQPFAGSGGATAGSAAMALGGRAGAGVSGMSGMSGFGQTSGGGTTSGGTSAGGTNAAFGGRPAAGGGSNTGGVFSRGGFGAGGRSRGGAAGAAAGSSPGGTTAAGGSSVGGAGSCVPDLACKPTAAPLSTDLHQDCVDRVNQFRTQCGCLPALERWTEGEACADQMAEYDAMQDTAHAGFSDAICDSGRGGQNECPGYSSDTQVISLCLQQMWSEGPGTENPCNGQCFEDHGHYINMTSTTMTKIACGFYTTSSGKVWAVQNFTR